VPCSYEFTALGKFALLRYLSEFRRRASSFELEVESLRRTGHLKLYNSVNLTGPSTKVATRTVTGANRPNRETAPTRWPLHEIADTIIVWCIVYESGGGVGPYTIFVCLFGDRALVNTILGIQHILYCTRPPVDFAMNIAQYMPPPMPPCFAIQHTILVMAISCKGQWRRRVVYCAVAVQKYCNSVCNAGGGGVM